MAKLHFGRAARLWRMLRRPLAPPDERDACIHGRGLWKRLRHRPQQVFFEGSHYCADRCLEHILAESLGQLRFADRTESPAHRVPLGLLLLERQELTADQLRRALAAQRAAGQGKIGEWLQTLGFVSAESITAALARQWSCPILRTPSLETCPTPPIPLALLEHFLMLPVHYVPSTATLHVAFSERIDYTVLYAIEQMLGCCTQPCLIAPGLLRQKLQKHSERRRPDREIVFDRGADVLGFAPSVRSYCQLTGLSEVRLTSCGSHLWARLLGPDSDPLDLILRLPLSRVDPDSPRSVSLGV